MKKLIKFLFHRVVFAGLLILLQAVLLVIMLVRFQEYFAYFYAVSVGISVLVSIKILSDDRTNPAYKIAWLIPIMLIPVFGGIFYLIFGKNRSSNHQRHKLMSITEKMREPLKQQPEVMAELAAENLDAANQSRYIAKYALCPVYTNTSSKYLALGEEQFEWMLRELPKAKKFIFMEYFIIHGGKMWDSILEILKERVANGVDVRVLYDDLGCIMTLPGGYFRKLEAMGIACRPVNPLRPFLDIRQNNRDHRKICVIDGNLGITGGINLADEYINEISPYGHWKDTAVALKGDAVWSLTVMFLTMWESANSVLKGKAEDYALYAPGKAPYTEALPQSDGFVQPFTDNPLDDESVSETIYLNMINKAKRYLYICTPYLIIDNEMRVALSNAAKSGVDVRILTPHIPDKKMIFSMTQSHYPVLLEAGVKIFEYTPGFVHAKSFVADDLYGVVGSVNMDYRSLFLHFECGAWLYGCNSVLELRDDYLATLKVSQEITLADCAKVPVLKRLWRSILRILAPLV